MLQGKNCLVIGSGISGVGSVGLLEYIGARVTLYDSSTELTEEALKAKLPEESRARCIAGEFPEELLKEVDTVVLSPGVPPTARPLPPPW